VKLSFSLVGVYGQTVPVVAKRWSGNTPKYLLKKNEPLIELPARLEKKDTARRRY